LVSNKAIPSEQGIHFMKAATEDRAKPLEVVGADTPHEIRIEIA
jgi:hypothetical protein